MFIYIHISILHLIWPANLQPGNSLRTVGSSKIEMGPEHLTISFTGSEADSDNTVAIGAEDTSTRRPRDDLLRNRSKIEMGPEHLTISFTASDGDSNNPVSIGAEDTSTRRPRDELLRNESKIEMGPEHLTISFTAESSLDLVKWC